MQEVVLIIHLILALAIILLVLIQRSSGGGLGIGGGGMGDFASARGAASVLSRATIICAFLFFATSLSLAVIAKHSGGRDGLLDGFAKPAVSAPAEVPVAPDAADTQLPEPPVTTE